MCVCQGRLHLAIPRFSGRKMSWAMEDESLVDRKMMTNHWMPLDLGVRHCQTHRETTAPKLCQMM